MTNLSHWNVLLTTLACGSFSAAAEKLGYTQSGLTHMMNTLEKEVGFPVLERGYFGVRLTQEGQALMPKIRALLQSAADLENAIDGIHAHTGNTLRIGVYPSMALHWLPTILAQFQSEYPDARVELHSVGVDSAYRSLADGSIDLAFASKTEKYICRWIPLCEDRLVAVLPLTCPVPADGVFPISAFGSHHFLMPSEGFDIDILRVLSTHGVNPDIQTTNVDDPTIVSMVAHGLGVCILSDLVVRNLHAGVQILPLSPACSRELGIALSPETVQTPAMKGLIATARVFARHAGDAVDTPKF